MTKTVKNTKKLALVPSEPSTVETPPVKVGSARGIESMFRNSYRAQLDMIALAATKANIMISLNGVLLSVLLVSGAYLMGSDRLLLIPLVVFLVTCTTAIIFAVLAARPDVDRAPKTLEDFRTDQADLLIFEQFSMLSSEDFNIAMQEMMQDSDRVYASMIAHIHSLGCLANKKFSRLYISYNAFIIGLVASVVTLAAVVVYHAMFNI